MKQWIVLSLCLVMCIALVGCHTTDRQNDEAREVLQRVLEKEQTFTSKTSMVSDAITEQTLDQYHFQTRLMRIMRLCLLSMRLLIWITTISTSWLYLMPR